MRSLLTETIQRVQGMVTYVRENLSTEEYDLYLDLVAPQAEPVVKPKKTRKRRTKSAHASSLQQRLHGKGRPKVEKCVGVIKMNGGDVVCEGSVDDPIHDKDGGYAGYHEFQPPEQAAATGDYSPCWPSVW